VCIMICGHLIAYSCVGENLKWQLVVAFNTLLIVLSHVLLLLQAHVAFYVLHRFEAEGIHNNFHGVYARDLKDERWLWLGP
jgi:hypothetical protein